MTRIRPSRPDSGLGVQVEVLKHSQAVPSSLGRGLPAAGCLSLAHTFSLSLSLSLSHFLALSVSLSPQNSGLPKMFKQP